MQLFSALQAHNQLAADPTGQRSHLGLHFLGLSKMFRNFPLVISRAGKGKMLIGYCNTKDSLQNLSDINKVVIYYILIRESKYNAHH